jgi:flagella basal body P-ring formation protein FlgA
VETLARLFWLLFGCVLCAAAGADPLPDSAFDAARALARSAAAALAPAGARIEVEAGLLDSRLHLAACARIEPWWPAGSRAWGRTRVGLRCQQGPSAWNVYLPMSVKVFAPAWVGSAPLPAGTVIEASHLVRAEVDWAAEPSPVLTRGDEIVGRTLARAVGAGQAVRGADLRPRQWFAAGETVQILASGSGFAVSGEGQALSPGFEGQTVRVRTDSGRIVSGSPVGERRVEVGL